MAEVGKVDRMIDIEVDREGESLRMSVVQALRTYSLDALHLFLENGSVLVRSAAARQVQIQEAEESFKYAVGLLGDKRAFARELESLFWASNARPIIRIEPNQFP